jgi:hypothetical protein
MELTAILGAFGLSASAGLNAYIPLLVVALAARFFPGYLTLAEPYDLLASNLAIVVLVVLLAVETLADKIPAVDHVNDVIGTVIRPVAGAILFAAATGAVDSLDPRLALVAGFLVAGVTHGAKSTARPLVTVSTAGVANPVVSAIEDVAALVTSLVAVIAPILIGVALVGFLVLVAWWYVRRQDALATP